mgnify:CR=1 FL=1
MSLTNELAAYGYLIAAICFIMALRGLSSPVTSRQGNLYGIVGMVIAIGVTVATPGVVSPFLIVAGLIVGGAIGTIVALRIQMTALPQLVAAFHSLVGLAAVFVAAAAFVSPEAFGIGSPGHIKTQSLVEMGLGTVIGAITFTGSIVAFAKLQGLVSGAPLLSLEVGGQRLQQRRVEVPQQKAKYLRLAWVRERSDDGAKIVLPEITAASGELAEKFIEATREWAKFNAGKGEKPGEYLFDLKGQFPIDRLRLELPEPNTIAQAEVLVRDKAEQPWRSVARTMLYRLRQPAGEIASPDITVGTSSERWWMIRIDQRGGGIGGGLPVLNAGWVPHQLVFAARGAAPFTLAYGNRGAHGGALPIESLIPGYRDDAGASVRVAKTGGQPTVNVQATSAQPQKELGGEARLQEQIDWKRWSLWGVLGLGVLALGGMAWRMVRQLQSFLPGQLLLHRFPVRIRSTWNGKDF